MVWINLFFTFFRIGLFAIGGAYSFLPLIEREVVQRYQWLSKEEFLDVLGVTQVFPGAISIKYATYAGYKMGGVLGVIMANLGNILAPTLMIIFASSLYARYKDSLAFKGALEAVRLCVFALIIAVAFQALDINNLLQAKKICIIILSFVVFTYTKAHPAITIILAAIAGAIWR